MKKKPITPAAPSDFNAWCRENKVGVAFIEEIAGVSQRTAYRYFNNESRLPRAVWLVIYRAVKES